MQREMPSQGELALSLCLSEFYTHPRDLRCFVAPDLHLNLKVFLRPIWPFDIVFMAFSNRIPYVAIRSAVYAVGRGIEKRSCEFQ